MSNAINRPTAKYRRKKLPARNNYPDVQMMKEDQLKEMSVSQIEKRGKEQKTTTSLRNEQFRENTKPRTKDWK